MDPPPPPPPPHGANAPGGGRSGGLPDGKYDIFVIPPSSSGAGFLYLPSLQTQRNSFLAGVACTAVTFFIWSIAIPVIKEWFSGMIHGGGQGVILLMVAVGVASWAWGKTQAEGGMGAGTGAGAGTGTGTGPGPRPSGPSTAHQEGASQSQGASYTAGGVPGPTPTTSNVPPQQPKSSWQRPNPQANTKAGTTSAKSSWEKAREETRKKEEERKRAEELKKRREDAEKERQKQREKDAKEREERELKLKKDQADKEAAAAQAKEAQKQKEMQEKADREKENLKPSPKKVPHATARTEIEDDAYSFRPYDRPKKPAHKANSAASIYSESSYAASQTTAKTTPPPSTRGPYSTKDPDKIIIKAVYSFNNAFTRTPVSQLISGQGTVTDGLILRITTEGLFIDDDVRGVPQREWDIKAWTMKLAESCELSGLHVLRASIRDQEGKKYVFVLSQSEGWKVAVGLQRLRRGTQVRALGVSGMPMNEAKAVLDALGWA